MAMKSHGMAFPRIRFQEATMEKPEHTPNEPSFVQVIFKGTFYINFSLFVYSGELLTKLSLTF